MFRRKDNDPPRPAEAKPEPLAPRPAEPARPSATPPAAPEMPRRQAEIPAAPSSSPFLASGERPSGGGGPSAGASAPAAPASAQNKRLIVGQGISLSGEITACDRLVVEGDVRVTLNETKGIEITPTGRFTDGKAEVDEAEISGLYEGDLTVRGRLMIRATGKVNGNVRYGELEIEKGGRITGSISMIDNGSSASFGGGSPASSSGSSSSAASDTPSLIGGGVSS